MKEEYVDELDDTLDDVEPVVDNPAELYEHFRVVVDKGQSQVRVDKYLFERLVNSSRNRIQKAADAGLIMANGKPVKSSYKVKPCDVLTVMIKRFRDYNDNVRKCEDIFEYYCSGNNRDGLAIKATCDGLLEREEENKILIVLSDGKPNDVKIGKDSSRSIRGEMSYTQCLRKGRE